MKTPTNINMNGGRQVLVAFDPLDRYLVLNDDVVMVRHAFGPDTLLYVDTGVERPVNWLVPKVAAEA